MIFVRERNMKGFSPSRLKRLNFVKPHFRCMIAWFHFLVLSLSCLSPNPNCAYFSDMTPQSDLSNWAHRVVPLLASFGLLPSSLCLS